MPELPPWHGVTMVLQTVAVFAHLASRLFSNVLCMFWMSAGCQTEHGKDGPNIGFCLDNCFPIGRVELRMPVVWLGSAGKLSQRPHSVRRFCVPGRGTSCCGHWCNVLGIHEGMRWRRQVGRRALIPRACAQGIAVCQF